MQQGQHTSTVREAILGRWLEAFFEPYPPSSIRFFGAHSDAFSNPVGATARRSLTCLLDYLLADGDERAAHDALEALVRLRAVQEIAPGRSLAFLTQIPEIVRQEIAGSDWVGAVDHLDRRAQALLLHAFDSYVADRERIFALRAREARSQVHSLLRRAGLVTEITETSDPESGERDSDPKGGREE